MRGRWVALTVVLLAPALAGCDTPRDGVRVNLTQAVRLYREQASRRPTREEAQQLIALLPPEQLVDLGVMYEREGRLEDAAEVYRQAIGANPLRPSSALAYVNLGNVRRRQGRTEEARTHYRQALTVAPGNFAAANNLGDLCAREQVDVGDAIARLAPLVVEPGPYRAYGLDTLGWLYHIRGDDERALETLVAARHAADAADTALLIALHEHLAEVCRARGQEAEASQHAAERARLLAVERSTGP